MSSPTDINGTTTFKPNFSMDPNQQTQTGHDDSRLSASPSDRRLSTDEWDASKVPPSRFQKRKGSIYATPGSRDGHVDRNYAQDFHDKHTAKGYGKKKSTAS